MKRFNKMLYAILIQPQSTTLDSKKGKPSPPFGLLCLSRVLDQEFEIRILDQRLPNFDRDLRISLQKKPLFAGVTAIAGPMIRHAVAISDQIKQISPATNVIWGGPHSMVAGDLAARHASVDAVAIADGEITIHSIAHALKNDQPLNKIKGLWLKNEIGDAICTGEPKLPDLSSLPHLSYEIVGDRYFYPSLGKPTAYFETSRGCPYRCSYCYQSSQRIPRRTLTPGQVLKSLRFLLAENPQVRHLYVVDDNYFFEEDRARDITERLIAEGIDLTYQIQGAAQVDLERMSTDDLRALRRSGCNRVDIGAESGSPGMAKTLGKAINPAQLMDLIKRLTQADIIPWINFMSGIPGEQAEDLERSIGVISGIARKYPKALISPVYAYYPYPGTRLYEIALQAGFHRPETITDIAEGSWRSSHSPWLTKKRRDTLERLYFYSIFIDDKVLFYRSSPIIMILVALMKPIAKFRFAKNFFKYPAEKWLFEKIFGADY